MLSSADFGLSERDIAVIIQVLKQYAEVQNAIIFGSRAKHTYKIGSDIDIALCGHDLTENIISQISYQLNEETVLPYKFDILNYHTIANLDLKYHIDKVGIKLQMSC
jgi:predicted nucleotidyltransferase